MFEDLHDALSGLWYWRWPIVEGSVTDVALQHTTRIDTADEVSLSVAFQFSIGEDGPYTGGRDWTSTHYPIRHILAARKWFHRGTKVRVRYRPDDPSINKLVPPSWRLW